MRKAFLEGENIDSVVLLRWLVRNRFLFSFIDI